MLLLTWQHDTNNFYVQRNNFCKLSYVFLLTKERREYVKPSISSVFTYFEYYTHIFGNILFWFNNKVLEAAYYYDFTELF